MAFEAHELALRYDGPRGRAIFEDLDLLVPTGQLLTILGGSGVGKSTLLRIMAGLNPPSAGTMSSFGKPVTGPPRDVVMVFQDYSRSLLPWRSVLANVTLGIERSLKRTQARERGMEALRAVGLADAADLHPRQLSGGMQQRVQIARAIAMRPRAIVMDEPFGALDAMTKASLQDQVRDLQASTGLTVVFVKHHVDQAVYLGDRAVVMAGKPAHISLDVEIGLGSVRDQVKTRASEEFLDLRAVLLAALDEAHT